LGTADKGPKKEKRQETCRSPRSFTWSYCTTQVEHFKEKEKLGPWIEDTIGGTMLHAYTLKMVVS